VTCGCVQNVDIQARRHQGTLLEFLQWIYKFCSGRRAAQGYNLEDGAASANTAALHHSTLASTRPPSNGGAILPCRPASHITVPDVCMQACFTFRPFSAWTLTTQGYLGMCKMRNHSSPPSWAYAIRGVVIYHQGSVVESLLDPVAVVHHLSHLESSLI
jgi:hypothetical protein